MITGTNNSEILTIKDSVIELGEVVMPLNEDKSGTNADNTKVVGNDIPYIKINGFFITSDLIKFQLSTESFLPKISIAFVDSAKKFESDFAKDGDLLELYIRSSNNDKFKKIRIDFDILKINSNVYKGVSTFNLTGIMRIPDIFSETQVSYPSNTSFNHLMDTCDEVGLGFASNDTETNDTMPRFNCNDTIKDFITNTSKTIYKDDKSFFTTYVDLHYYLCLVNVNTLFSMNEELEDGIVDLSNTLTGYKDTGTEGNESKVFFSNHPQFNNSTSYITDYKLFNNAGNIWMANGYKRYVDFVNMKSTEYESFFIDPLTTDGAESEMVLLKGRANDDSYERQNKYSYRGRLYSTENGGNLHPNYYYANILNYQNLTEINKMGLTVTLNGISSNIYKYKRIPVFIYDSSDNTLQKVTSKKGDSNRGTAHNNNEQQYDNTENQTLNQFISGFYVVSNYTIKWDKNRGYTQVANLVRREWPTPNYAGMAVTKTN